MVYQRSDRDRHVTPHSANVRLWLIVDNRCVKLGSIGPDAVTLHQDAHNERCQPCSGVVLMTVDGEPTTWVVDLPDGVAGDTVRIVRRGETLRAETG